MRCPCCLPASTEDTSGPPDTLPDPPTTHRQRSPTMSRSAALVDADWVEQHLDDPSVVLVEVDEDTTAYDRGHSRGAVKIDWKQDLQDPVRRDFVNKEQFEQLLGSRG